jgi:hypothetical protein
MLCVSLRVPVDVCLECCTPMNTSIIWGPSLFSDTPMWFGIQPDTASDVRSQD